MKLEWSPNAVEKYRHKFSTGSGSFTVYLQVFADERVDVTYDLGGMGNYREFVRMHGSRWKLSEHHGVLKIQMLELVHKSKIYPIIELYREAYPNATDAERQSSFFGEEEKPTSFFGEASIYFEYILLPESATHLPVDDAMASMYAMRWATQDMITFDLLVWLHSSYEALFHTTPLDAEWKTAIDRLRLTKFQYWDESLEPTSPISDKETDVTNFIPF
jgi:hypothetical protein